MFEAGKLHSPPFRTCTQERSRGTQTRTMPAFDYLGPPVSAFEALSSETRAACQERHQLVHLAKPLEHHCMLQTAACVELVTRESKTKHAARTQVDVLAKQTDGYVYMGAAMSHSRRTATLTNVENWRRKLHSVERPRTPL